jgi:cyclohexyl-isocyanide hydratase
MTDAGFAIVPTHTLAQVTTADVICVPGGAGADDAMEDAEIINWLRDVSSSAQWITSVCTGSLVLGAAGLLRGKKATSHWTARDMLADFGAIPTLERYVIDGNVVTGGGVTAGIDFALFLTSILRGEDHAKRVQLALEYDPSPPFACGSPEKADTATLAAVEAIVSASKSKRAARVKKAAAAVSGRQ